MFVLTIDIVHLSWPEEKEHKVISAAKEGDEQNHDHCLLRLGEQCFGNHGIGCIEFPDEKGDDQDKAKDQWRDIVSTPPRVLLIVSLVHCTTDVKLTWDAPHCRPIMNNVMPNVLRIPPI